MKYFFDYYEIMLNHHPTNQPSIETDSNDSTLHKNNNYNNEIIMLSPLFECHMRHPFLFHFVPGMCWHTNEIKTFPFNSKRFSLPKLTKPVAILLKLNLLSAAIWSQEKTKRCKSFFSCSFYFKYFF